MDIYLNDSYEGQVIYIDDDVKLFTGSFKHISINSYSNSWLQTGVYDEIEIECENGYIKKIEGFKRIGAVNKETIDLQGMNQSEVKVSVKPEGSNWINNFATLRCQTPVLHLRQIGESEHKAISKDTSTIAKSFYDGTIDETDIQDFKPQQAITSQPRFVDILYLQLKTIFNLQNAISTLNPDISFQDIFHSQYDQYNQWLDKFTKANKLEDLIESFTGSATLKDIGIAQDVIAGLVKCQKNLLNNPSATCNGLIKINVDINDKFDFYKLEDITHRI